MNNFNFDRLFVLDIANNHQGDLNHGLKIINSMSKVIKENKVDAAIKFQFRQLDSLIHPNHRQNSDAKHIDRFISTKLDIEDYKLLLNEIKKNGLKSICTPFDELSVDIIVEMKFDFIKVASCSAKDWPLLEKIASAGLPVIASTGGLTIPEVDSLVSFFEHRGIPLAIMHCVSIYPTPNDKLNINQIDFLKSRYPKNVIGWSTHEDPNNYLPIQIALSKGAKIFERHIGLETDKYKLNAYSSTPEQIDNWIKAYIKAEEIISTSLDRNITSDELKSLKTLFRGIYVNKDIKKGTKINTNDIYFAMPLMDGQIESGKWRNDLKINVDLKKDDPLNFCDTIYPSITNKNIIKNTIHKVKALLNESKIYLNSDFKIEFSHHHGIEEFEKIGAVIINCINREYCKKIIVQLPGQIHPMHYHKRKEETFQILQGVLETQIDGHIRSLNPGETVLIQPGVWHSFWTKNGCIFEEISTTHFDDDSIYSDKVINDLNRDSRKTIVENWGRFEIN